MILHRLRISNYRDVGEAEISPLPKGITVVLGANETGKTCLAEALRLVFQELDSSQKQRVKAIKPVHHDVGSEVEVEIETGPYRFVLYKSFNKAKETRVTITQPKSESLLGREAHERVQKMLLETLDLDLWDALCIVQGAEVSQPILSGKSSLSSALDKAAGTAPAGDNEESLFESTEIEFQKYYTPKTEEEKGELKDVRQRVGQIQADVTALTERFGKIESDVKKSEELNKTLQALRPKRKTLEESSNHSKAVLEEARAKHAAFVEVESQKKLAESNYKMALQAQELRKALTKEVGDLGQQLASQSQGLNDADQELLKMNLELEQLEKRVTSAESELETARTVESVRRMDAEHYRNKLDLAQLSERLERVRNAQREASAATKLLATNKVDDKALESIRAAQEQMEFSRGKLAAGVPSLKIKALRKTNLEVGDRSIQMKPNETLEEKVPDKISLRVPQVVDIEVTPGTSSDDLRQSLRIAEQHLEEILNHYNVKDMQTAIQANSNRSDALAKRQQLGKVLKDNLRDLTVEELEAKVAELRERDQSHMKTRRSDLPMASDREDAKRLLKDAEAIVATEALAFKNVQNHAQAARSAHAKASSRQIQLKTTVDMTRERLSISERRLLDARTNAEDKTLDDDVEKSGLVQADSERRLKSASLEVRKLDIEVLRTCSENAESILERCITEVNQTEKQLDEVSYRIKMYEDEGLFDKLQMAESSFEHSKRELDRLQRLANASRLLYNVMNSARSAAQETYVRPLKERIERLGRVVFGDSFLVNMNPDLSIAERTLDGRTVPFDSLSKGAQEQIGVITRLACAMIVSRDGGVPVIIDDALGYSDSARLEAMGAVIALAGKECQVIVLTCMPDRYRYVGGAKVIEIGSGTR